MTTTGGKPDPERLLPRARAGDDYALGQLPKHQGEP
jgi:hypothetical protein